MKKILLLSFILLTFKNICFSQGTNQSVISVFDQIANFPAENNVKYVKISLNYNEVVAGSYSSGNYDLRTYTGFSAIAKYQFIGADGSCAKNDVFYVRDKSYIFPGHGVINGVNFDTGITVGTGQISKNSSNLYCSASPAFPNPPFGTSIGFRTLSPQEINTNPNIANFTFNNGNNQWQNHGTCVPNMVNVYVILKVFSLNCPNPAPTLAGANTAGASGMTFLFSAPQQATGQYEAELVFKTANYPAEGSNAPNPSIGYQRKPFSINAGLGGVTFENLVAGQTYKIRARAVCTNGTKGSWGAPQDFTMSGCNLTDSFNMKTILDTSGSLILPYVFNDGPEICVKKTCNGSPTILVPSPTALGEPTTIFNWINKGANFDFTKLVSNASGLEVYRKDGANDKWFLIPNPAQYQPKSGIMLEKFALIYKSILTPVSTQRCFIGMVGLDVMPSQYCFFVAQKGSNEPIDQPCYVCNKSKVVAQFAYMKAQLKGPCTQGNTNTANNTIYNLNGFDAGTAMKGLIDESPSTLYKGSNLPLTAQRTAYNVTIQNVESISPAQSVNIINNGLVNNFFTFKWVPLWNQNRNQSNYIFSSKRYSELTTAINYKSGVRVESYNPNGAGVSSFVVFANSNIIYKQSLNEGNPAAGPGRRPGDAPNKFYSISNGVGGSWVEKYSNSITSDIADLFFQDDTGTTVIQCMTFRDLSDRYELKPADPANPLKWKQTLNGVTSTGDYQLSSPGTIGIALTPTTNVPIFLSNFNKLNGKRVKLCTACPTINFNDVVITTKVGANAGSDAAKYASVVGETTMNVNLKSVAVWPCTNPVYAYDVDIFKLDCTIPGTSSRMANPDKTEISETEIKPSTFPNPFTTELNIKFTAAGLEEAYFEVFDLQGKKMYNSAAQKLEQGSFVQETLDTSSWATGMYIVKTFAGNGESSVQKVVKQ